MVNNREAGDLRRYRTHYDITVMITYKKNPNALVIPHHHHHHHYDNTQNGPIWCLKKVSLGVWVENYPILQTLHITW